MERRPARRYRRRLYTSMTNHSSPGPLLSIIVPCHNSMLKMERLGTTLRGLSDPDVECVLIDDGSTDDTVKYLEALRESIRCPCIVGTQENKGPGGAKNHGLARANGKYVWFVDSDDDINPQAMAALRELHHLDYDFIDFGVEHFAETAGRVRPSIGARAGALALPPGEYRAAEVTRLFLLHSVGWLWTKVFNRAFLLRHRLCFPEHCIYEDTLWLFWLPLVVDRFYKSDLVGYYHHQDVESVTRTAGRQPYRFYDRLLTASLSVEVAKEFPSTPEERARIEDKFCNIFLIHTVQMLQLSRDWGMIPRVVRLYREEVKRLGVTRRIPRGRSSKFAKLLLPWLVSYLYPPQAQFFEQTHLRAWARAISFPAPPRQPRAEP